MPYTGKVIHYSSDATTQLNDLTSRKTDARFTIRRLGGCGPGELKLKDFWSLRDTVQPGHYIAFEYDTGDRWYFGRVESVTSDVPAGHTIALEGLSAELAELHPGGFGGTGDSPPRVWGKSDYFVNDPNYEFQTFKTISQPEDLVTEFYNDYIFPYTNVTTSNIEYASPAVGISSFKFEGRETVLSAMRQMGIACRDASWGVDQNKKFYFLRKRGTVLKTFRVGRDVQSLSRERDRSLLYNRLTLTGDYIYNGDQFDSSGEQLLWYGFYRWQAHFRVASSIQQYGERRVRLSVPWLRRNSDAQQFAIEFFRKYARMSDRYRIRTTTIDGLPRPWEGQIRLEGQDGSELVTSHFDTLNVGFGRTPYLEFELGPEDLVWNDDPREDRWELPQIPRRDYPPPTISLPPTWTGSESSLSTETITSSDSSGTDYTPCECQFRYTGNWNVIWYGCAEAGCVGVCPYDELPEPSNPEDCVGGPDDPADCFAARPCTESTTTTASCDCPASGVYACYEYLKCLAGTWVNQGPPAGYLGCPSGFVVQNPPPGIVQCSPSDTSTFGNEVLSPCIRPECTTTTTTTTTTSTTTTTTTTTTSTTTTTTSTTTTTTTTSTTTTTTTSTTTTSTTTTTTTTTTTSTTTTTTTAGPPCGYCQWVCFGMMGDYAWFGDGDFCTGGCGCQEPVADGCNAGTFGTTTQTNCA